MLFKKDKFKIVKNNEYIKMKDLTLSIYTVPPVNK